MDTVLGVLLVVGVGLVGFLGWHWFKPRSTRERGALYFISEGQWEDRVLRLTRDDRGAMERAITARRRKFPQATRLELLKMVHDGYLRDRE